MIAFYSFESDTVFHMRLLLYMIVVIQCVFSLISIAFVSLLAILKKRGDAFNIIYLYEIFLVALYWHFLQNNSLSCNIYYSIYWAALIGMAPLSCAPLLLEWNEYVRLYGDARKPNNKSTKFIIIAVVSLAITATISVMFIALFKQLEQVGK